MSITAIKPHRCYNSTINDKDDPGRGREHKRFAYTGLQNLYLNIVPLRKEISFLHNWFISAF